MQADKRAGQESEEQLEMATHNLLCYSKNYLMTEPRPGFEREYQEALHEVECLKRLVVLQKSKKKKLKEPRERSLFSVKKDHFYLC